MVEIITPLRIKPKSPGFTRCYHTRIIEIAFCNENKAPRKRSSQCLNFSSVLFQEMNCRAIDKCMDGIKSKPIDVIIAQPHQGVIAEKTSHFVRFSIFKVD